MPPPSEGSIPAAFRTPQASKYSMTPPTSQESSEYIMSVDRTIREDMRIRPSPGFSDDDGSLTLEEAMIDSTNAMKTSPPGALDAHLQWSKTERISNQVVDARKEVQSMGDIDVADRRRSTERRLMSGRNPYDDARSLGDLDLARRRSIAVLRSNEGYGGRSPSDFDDVKSMGDLSKVSVDTQQLKGLTPQELARIRLRKQQKMALRRQAEKIEGEQFDQPANSLGAFLSQNRRCDSDGVASLGEHSDKSSDNDTFTDMFKWSSATDDTGKPSASKSVGAATAPPSLSKRSGSIGGASRSTSGGASRRSSSQRRSSSSKRRGSKSVGAPVERRKSKSSAHGLLGAEAPDAIQRPRSNSYADGLYRKDDDSLKGLDRDDLDQIQNASDAMENGRERLRQEEQKVESRRSRSSKASRRSKSAADVDGRSRRSRREERKKSKSRSENKSSKSERHRSSGRSRRDDDGSIGSRDPSKRSSSSRRKSSSALEKGRKRSLSRHQKSPKSTKSPPKSRSSEENRKSSRSKSRKASDDSNRRSGNSKAKRGKSKKRSSSRPDAVVTSPTSVDRRGYDSTYDSQYDTTNEGGFRPEDDSFSNLAKDTDADNSGRSNVIQKNNLRGALSKAESEETIEVEQEILFQFHPCTPGNTERMNISSMNSSFVRINNGDGSTTHRMIYEMPSTPDPSFPPDNINNFSDTKTVSSAASMSKMASDGSTQTDTASGRGRKKMIEVMKGAKGLMERARSKSRGAKGRKHRRRSRSLRKSFTERGTSSPGETQSCSDDDEAQLLSGRLSSCENEDEPSTPSTPRRRRSGVGMRSRTKTQ